MIRIQHSLAVVCPARASARTDAELQEKAFLQLGGSPRIVVLDFDIKLAKTTTIKLAEDAGLVELSDHFRSLYNDKVVTSFPDPDAFIRTSPDPMRH
jgi:hypothetical protein